MGRNSRLGVELSGGLDSSIVAGAARAMELPIALTLNTRGPQPETDERRFATMMANWIGLPLEVRLRQEVVFTAEAFEATAGDPWPSQNGRDLANDLTVVEACRSAGVDRLLTGKGGDALFFQMHTPLTFADLWRRRPIQALLSPALPGVARWTRSSTWSVLRASRHALQDLKVHDLSPGKRMQIAAIESGLAYYSRCLRSDVVDMVHPLMSQPLIEWALRTPVPDLTPGGQERGLARRVFADRLPEAIANRRAKGDYAAYFNQQTAANLPFLRDYLLGGRLADQSVFDRADMEARLVPDRLLWRGGAAEILAAVSTEAWVRRWEARMTAGR
ncbi:asparagine synthase C-terminal domain-containing protein [Brevundimonas nasdae]|uniref:Asparagine synthase C-terminal domain-containing protein n=3 Tax=Brevundimonas nasdae TaxID=172043 RepID=A0ABX8TDP1_9CAUL|nr:asparagine synthase C-terminal domain-containing protein [Brevundimonas nasdae]